VFGRITERIKTVHCGEDRWRQDLIDWGIEHRGTHKEKSRGFVKRKTLKSSRLYLKNNKMEDLDHWSRGNRDRRSSAKGFHSFGIQGTEGAGPFGLAICETLMHLRFDPRA
jgi:hypothetical protein